MVCNYITIETAAAVIPYMGKHQRPLFNFTHCCFFRKKRGGKQFLVGSVWAPRLTGRPLGNDVFSVGLFAAVSQLHSHLNSHEMHPPKTQHILYVTKKCMVSSVVRCKQIVKILNKVVSSHFNGRVALCILCFTTKQLYIHHKTASLCIFLSFHPFL